MSKNTSSLIESIQRHFPACVTEAKGKDGQIQPAIDFDLLRQELSDRLIEGTAERYQLNWPGKRNALLSAGQPIRKSFFPQLKESLHFQTTQNLFIEGDNLDALKLLQETYLARVKAIYIDPPYNTGKDFLYKDKFAMSKAAYAKQTGQRGQAGGLAANPDSGGRYHSNWLSMMYPRLKLARNLLAKNGAIFISIDDHEQHNLRKLMDEIFGSCNFIAQFCWIAKASPQNDAKNVSSQHEYVICYAREIDEFKIGLLPRTEEMNARYQNPDNDERGLWMAGDISAKSGRPESIYELTFPNGVVFECPPGRFPIFSKTKFLELYHDNRLWFGKTRKSQPKYKRFLADVKQGRTPISELRYQEVGSTLEANKDLQKLVGKGMFSNPKPVRLVEHLLRLSTSPITNYESENYELGKGNGKGKKEKSVIRN